MADSIKVDEQKTTGNNSVSSRRRFLEQVAVTGATVGLLTAETARAQEEKTETRDSVQHSSSGVFRGASTKGISRYVSQTLLNSGGTLRRDISEKQYRSWLAELKSLPARVSSRRSALLNLWVGEYAMTTGQEPVKALHHFRLAKKRTKRDDVLHGWACYNECLALTFDSQYNEAASGFAHLLYGHKKTNDKPLCGFDWRIASAWYRRMAARAAEFNRLAAMGIPRPPSLDTICGAGGLALCLRALKLPYDKAHVLANVRVTGRGSTLQDLLDACPNLGLNGYSVIITGREALERLPKPLIVHVERDHFVGVVEANDKGVVYMCTDCGRWPGGRVEVTWKQWQAMTPGAALCVAIPGSDTDKVLAALVNRKEGKEETVHVASSGNLSGLAVTLSPLYHRLSSAVVAYPQAPSSAMCGMPPGVSPDSKNNKSKKAVDPVDPVDLSSGEEIYSCVPDMVVYNPHGPDVVFQRYYNSLRGFSPGYTFDMLGMGWSHSYDIYVYDPHGSYPQVGIVWQEVGGLVERDHYESDTLGSLNWKITYNQSVIASSDTTNGWWVSQQGDPDQYRLYVPSNATVYGGVTSAEGYRLRVKADNNGTLQNAVCKFNVGHIDMYPLAGTGKEKYLVYPSGSTLAFTCPTIANSLNPLVTCQVKGGADVKIEMCYGGVGIGLYYIITFSDGTKWQTTRGRYTREFDDYHFFTPGGFRYAISKITDRLGNGLVFEYGADPSDSFPYTRSPSLTAIRDNTQDNNLLLALTTTASSSSIQSSFGFVIFEKSLFSITNPHPGYSTGQYELVSASFVSPTSSSTGNRFEYEYQNVYNGRYDEDGNRQKTPFLNIVKEPRQQSDGSVAMTTVATIEYEAGTCFASVVCDPYGNRHVYEQIDSDGNVVNGNGNFDTPTEYTRVSVRTPDDADLVTAYTVRHDENQNCKERIDGGGVVVQTTSFADPLDPYLPTAVTDGNGKTVSYTYNANGDVETITSPRGTVTQFTYSAVAFPDNKLIQVQTGSVTPTTFEYYPNTLLLQKVTAPLPSGGTGDTLFEYDALGNPTKVTTPGNNAVATFSTSMSYTESPASLDDFAIPHEFDGDWAHWHGETRTVAPLMGRPRKITDAAGRVTRFYYGSSTEEVRGFLFSVRDPQGRVTRFNYNIIGQTESVLLPDDRVILYEYLYQGGPVRRVVVATNADDYYNDPSSATISETIYSYGLRNELLKTEGGAETVRYVRDGINRLASIYDGRDNELAYYGYTDRGLLWYEGLSNSNDFVFRVFGYDNAGNTTSTSEYFYNGSGSNDITFEYNDGDGLLSAVSYGTGHPRNVALTYDLLGRLSARTDGTGTQSYTYNHADALTQVSTEYNGLTDPLTVSYEYHNDGSRKKMTTPAGVFDYQYDVVGRMVQLMNPFGQTTTWTYTGEDQVLRQLMYNGVATDYEYDALGRLAKLTNLKTSGTTQILSKYEIPTDGTGYDGNDYVKRVSTTITNLPSLSGVTEYLYGSASSQNHAHWLTGEQSTRLGGYTNQFSYDKSGNLTNFKGQSRSYDLQNQLVGGSAFVYDERGNPTTYKNTSFTFDADNNPIAFGNLLTAGYTSDGLRAWKQDQSGKRFYFLYDGVVPVVEMEASSTNSTSTVFAVNTFGGNGLISRWNKYQTFAEAIGGSDPPTGGVGGDTDFTLQGEKPGSATQLVASVLMGSREFGDFGNEDSVLGLNGLFIDEAEDIEAENSTEFSTPSTIPTVYFQNTFYTYDERGNVSERTSRYAQVFSRSSSDAYGATQTFHTDGQPYSFILGDPYRFGAQFGYYTDTETGLILCTFRYYDPSTGRWINRDPIGYSGGVNLYAYCLGDPINSIDPSGLDVNLFFERAKGVLTARDLQTNKRVTIYNVFSGNVGYRKASDEHIPTKGPIPAGEYLIGNGYAHKLFYEISNKWWYPLYGHASNGFYSYTHIPLRDPNGNLVWRGQYNLHAGLGSNGCVTVPADPGVSPKSFSYPKSNDYERLRLLLDATSPLPDAEGLNKIIGTQMQRDTYKIIGKLIVK